MCSHSDLEADDEEFDSLNQSDSVNQSDHGNHHTNTHMTTSNQVNNQQPRLPTPTTDNTQDVRIYPICIILLQSSSVQ